MAGGAPPRTPSFIASPAARHQQLSVLIIGCAAAGKTLLVRQLRHYCKHGTWCDDHETTSTTGTEIDEVVPPGESRSIRLREAGSPMTSLWPSYFPEARGVVYVLDLSQPLGISGAIMELFDVLSHPGTAGKPFALVLNKGDAPYRLRQPEVEALLRLPDLQASMGPRLHVMETSATTGSGVDALLAWLLHVPSHGDSGPA